MQDDPLLKRYMTVNACFHNKLNMFNVGKHSYPCAVWDNLKNRRDKLFQIFAHGLMPRNWALTTICIKDFNVEEQEDAGFNPG